MSIAMQIADAMQFLHMANIVHRDLKPSNCLVCILFSPLPACGLQGCYLSSSRASVPQIDHNGVVKLCDFGLARVMGREPSNSSENSRAGTPVYLAPEALQGAPTTNKVDVYRYWRPLGFSCRGAISVSLADQTAHNTVLPIDVDYHCPATFPQFLHHRVGNDDWPTSMGDFRLQANGGSRPARPPAVDDMPLVLAFPFVASGLASPLLGSGLPFLPPPVVSLAEVE